MIQGAPPSDADIRLDRARWITVLGSLALALGLVVVSWLTSAGPWAAWGLSILLNGIILVHAVWHRDAFIGRLFLFGVIAGFAELPSDYFSVVTGDTLVYPEVGPFIWTSPAYMPFGYSILLVQFGWIARWFTKRFGMPLAILLAGLMGGVNVPFYEFFAKGAGFWEYQNLDMLFGTVPYYIIAGEFVFVAVLPFIVRRLERSGWLEPVFWGLVEGVVMYVAWWGGFQLLQ
jgi:hypothetical protein